jgi:hypothetical protein
MRRRTGDELSMKTLKIIFALILLNGYLIGQDVYKIPFASNNNTIELLVVNGSSKAVSGIKVEADSLPAWIQIGDKQKTISFLKPNLEQKAVFTFAVDKSAPVGKEQTLTFAISTPNGESWTKQIKIIVTAPLNFKLYQNYPNPFNPATVIGYQLPVNGFVTLKIYNVLGQEVATLVNEFQLAGYKSIEFNAGSLPSGVYFYRAVSGKFIDTKKMVLVR